MASSFGNTISGVRHSGAGAYDALGKWSEGGTDPISFKGSIQPPLGDDMASLPEGRREVEAYRIYSEFELKTVDENGKINPDKLTLFGKTNAFEVVRVEAWQNGVRSHYESLVALIG